jgi:cysteine desulfurase
MTEQEKIYYFDNGDTTRIDDRVLEYMLPFYTKSYGNPVSLHTLGMEADENLLEARTAIASTINAQTDELFFTSGATESNNMAIDGIADYNKESKNHIIISTIEHASVRETAHRLRKRGFEVDEVKVDSDGFVDLSDLKDKIKKETVLISIIHGNYEIGTIQDIKSIGAICKENDILFHTDAAQSYGKCKIDVVENNIDLLSINAHKIHGPKGVGALYIKKGTKISKLFEGGSHEAGKRPGTENLPAIMGFKKAAELIYEEFEANDKIMIETRNRLINGLTKIDHVFLNGPKEEKFSQRLSNNADITFQYIEGEAILMHLSLRNICVSSGSACSSKSLEPSHVLTAIGLKHEQAHGSIRFTVSKYTTEEEVDYVIENMKEVVKTLREMTAFIPEEHSELENENAKTFYKNKK